MAQSTKTFTFHILVECVHDVYVATCLETSLVASSDEEMDAVSKMSKLIVRQVQFALKNENPGDIFHLAPKEVWDKFMSGEDQRFLSESLTPISLNHIGGVAVNQTYVAIC